MEANSRSSSLWKGAIWLGKSRHSLPSARQASLYVRTLSLCGGGLGAILKTDFMFQEGISNPYCKRTVVHFHL